MNTKLDMTLHELWKSQLCRCRQLKNKNTTFYL